MLIPRQQSIRQYPAHKINYKRLHESGLDVRAIYKSSHSTNNNQNKTANLKMKKIPSSPINKLLNTAAAGTGVVGDLDALLTPIMLSRSSQDQNNSNNSSKNERTERNLWRNDEIREMLYVMQQVKALEKLNDKTVKSENVFKDVEIIMHRNGYVKKSHLQIWTKWKFLKSTYMTSRRNRVMPRIIPTEVYKILHEMLMAHNQSLSDCGNSTNGDDDSIGGGGGGAGAGAGAGAMATSIADASSSTLNKNNSTAETAGSAADDSTFGMAHPIFGFRLGLIKDEPVDTSYENGTTEPKKSATNRKDPQEDDEQEVEEQIVQKQKQPAATPPTPKKKPTEEIIPHRGRGRPPKNTYVATSTPNNSTPAATATSNAAKQMPPLRVAPFAKVATNSVNALAVNRPPPPLTMPPNQRPIRITMASLSDSIANGGSSGSKFMQPKLVPKPSGIQFQTRISKTPPLQQMRIAKDLNRQGRQSSTPSPSYPKLKAIPMRKTPYSLRPDRAIPDLSGGDSPPETEKELYQRTKPEEVQVAKQINLSNQSKDKTMLITVGRKRPLDWQESPISAKSAKYKSGNEGDDEASRHENKRITCREQEQQTDGTKERLEQPKQIGEAAATAPQDYGRLMKNVTIDLSSSLRSIQMEMMRDFFEKQKELMEQEHAFQLQQDRMIMKAFQEQTQEIMRSVKDLMMLDKSTLKPLKKFKKQRKNEAKRSKKQKAQRQKQQKQQQQQQQMFEEHIEINDDDDDEEADPNYAPSAHYAQELNHFEEELNQYANNPYTDDEEPDHNDEMLQEERQKGSIEEQEEEEEENQINRNEYSQNGVDEISNNITNPDLSAEPDEGDMET